MSKVEVKLDDKGMEELLRSPPVLADLKRRADRIAAVCGFGYKAYAEQGRSRARASVVAATRGARRDNARKNTLIRNMSAGR